MNQYILSSIHWEPLVLIVDDNGVITNVYDTANHWLLNNNIDWVKNYYSVDSSVVIKEL